MDNTLASAIKDSRFDAPRRHGAEELADLAVRALREEAVLTPKPGLVDQRSCGAHHDMDLALLLRSANALKSAFARVAKCAATTAFGTALREQLAVIGRDGEAAMLAATGSVNTHRGAIWSLGLLIAAYASAGAEANSARDICQRAGEIARLPIAPSTRVSHGRAMFLRHGARGARGEAESGFAHVYKVALPALRAARKRYDNENFARLHALLALIASLDDTCLLYRGGRAALTAAQIGAQHVLALGVESSQGYAALLELDRRLIELNASPGGSADLLAATLFVDRIAQRSERFHGNA